MALNFRLKAGNASPGEQCLTTLQGVLQAVAKYVSVIGPDGLSGVIVSANEPSVDDRDKIWLKLEANDKPIGFFIYKDGWIQVPGVHQGAIMLYSGAVADIPAGWELADGLDGAPDLTDSTDFASLWEPNYSALETTYSLAPIWFKGFA